MRTSRVLVVTAVVASLACISAMAADVPSRPPGQGHVYLKVDLWKGVPGKLVPLPEPKDPGGIMPERGAKLGGPVSLSSPRMETPRGSAIPSMSSGTFMSPTERTRVQIHRLIRRLG